MYELLKWMHVGCVTLSVGLFALRGAWALMDSPLMQRKSVRVLPHVIDTVLLASAIALVVMSGQYPFVEHWLTVKVFALIAYIVLGTLAIRRAPTRSWQAACYVAALVTAAFMISVALSRDPMGFLSAGMQSLGKIPG